MPRKILLLIGLLSSNVMAAPRMSHHGEFITKCHNPLFFNEVPIKETSVASLERFSVTASDNTDIKMIKFSINNQPFAATLERLRSGRILISGLLDKIITTPGTILLKVAAESNDGCNALYAWRVYVK